MSTLNVSNITDGTTTVGTSYVVNGSAKAWVNFNGTGTIAARDSLNLSSLTDNATGTYTVNFTNAFGDGDYSYAGVGRDGGSTAASVSLEGSATPSASSIKIVAVVPNVALRDTDRLTLNVFGDLA